jgi:hypothetical protein
VIVLVGLAWVDEVVQLRMPAPAGRAHPPLPRRLLGSTGLAIVAAASALATLVNPFAIDAWRYIERLARNPEITAQVSEWQPPSPLDPAGAIFYVSLIAAVATLVFRLRSDRGRPSAQFLAPILAIAVFGALGIVTGRGLAWWALVAPVAIVALQPGLRLADLRATGLPALRARTAREASMSEARRSPVNALMVVVLAIAAVVLLPAWRPLGPAGVPAGTLSNAPQAIAAKLDFLVDAGLPDGARIWAPQIWTSYFEFAVPGASYAVDSRIELFPAQVWADAHDLAAGKDGAWSILVRYDADAIVIRWDGPPGREREADSPSDDVFQAVLASGFWAPVYDDADGVILVRSRPRR